MAILEILTYPDKFLRRQCKPVDKVDDEIKKIIEDMAETMYAAPGLGLAAPQVGIDKQILIMDTSTEENPKTYRAIINPTIVKKEGWRVSENEGCLSVPDFRADVQRYEFVRVEALDGKGNPIVIGDDGLLSVVLQHEIDHLHGVLFIDRISSLKRSLYKRQVKKRLKQSR